jgi:hypothetical protein
VEYEIFQYFRRALGLGVESTKPFEEFRADPEAEPSGDSETDPKGETTKEIALDPKGFCKAKMAERTLIR